MNSKYLFVILLLFIASCSRKSDVELFNEGNKAEVEKNVTVALEKYNEVVNEFPTTAYAESSQYRIAMIKINQEGNKQQAVEAHLKFYRMFPRSKQAPAMLFLAAFLYNNDLRNLDSARVLYEEFIQKYPGHDLAESAKFELANLGKSPDEYLKSEVSSSEKKETRQ
jgi:TolA-binding protein